MAEGTTEMIVDVTYKLIATEPEGFFKPNKVIFLGGVTVGARDDFFWASWIEAPASIAINDQDRVVLLASRHHGYSLKDLSDLPIDVYVCEVKDRSLILEMQLKPEDVSIIAWALMLPPGDERGNLAEIYESIKEKLGNMFYINPVHK